VECTGTLFDNSFLLFISLNDFRFQFVPFAPFFSPLPFTRSKYFVENRSILSYIKAQVQTVPGGSDSVFIPVAERKEPAWLLHSGENEAHSDLESKLDELKGLKQQTSKQVGNIKLLIYFFLHSLRL
jgi:hypothetical protein